MAAAKVLPGSLMSKIGSPSPHQFPTYSSSKFSPTSSGLLLAPGVNKGLVSTATFAGNHALQIPWKTVNIVSIPRYTIDAADQSWLSGSESDADFYTIRDGAMQITLDNFNVIQGFNVDDVTRDVNHMGPSVTMMHKNNHGVTQTLCLEQNDDHAYRLLTDSAPSVVLVSKHVSWSDASTKEHTTGLKGHGTGIIVNSQGDIVTNYHVVKNASDIRVTLLDKSTYPAEVVGYEEHKDIAVLHIDAPEEKLSPVRIGVSAGLHVGQTVYAIGHPFGLEYSLSVGRISGLRRQIPLRLGQYLINLDAIQIDAAINPGNSGGPLFDSAGNLIGINTAIYSYSGIGLSIPIDSVIDIIKRLAKSKKDTLGVLN